MTKTNTILQDAKNLEGKKVLYFEPVGADFEQTETNGSDVLYCRIRTSFLNNDGEQIFIDLGNTYMKDSKGKSTEKMGTWIDFCFKVPANKDEEIKYHEIYKRHEEHLILNKMPYTKENIVKWINERLNCDFETMHVLDSMYNYHTGGNNGTYNLMENIVFDHETTLKQWNAFNEYYEWYTKHRKFPCLEIIERTNDFIKIRTSDSQTMIDKNNIERVKTVYFS